MVRICQCLSIVVLAGQVNLVSAENNVDLFQLSLEELSALRVVTAASGFEQKVTQAPATVTVITSQEWQARGAQTLSEVLNWVPGFHVSEPSVEFKHKKFYLRGLSGQGSSQIKLLVDGEPLEQSQDNGIFWGFVLPLTSFQRIEVIKGPGSVVYGADAFGGIVNLVSYSKDEVEPVFGGRLGSFDSYDFFGRGSFSYLYSYFQWSFDYSESKDDHHRVIDADLQSTFDSIFGTDASLAPGTYDEHYKVFTGLLKWQKDELSIDMMTWRNFDYGVAAGIAQALDPKGSGAYHFNHLKAQYDLSELATGSLVATLSYKQQKSNNFLNIFPPGTLLPIGADGNLNFIQPVGIVQFPDGLIGTPSPRGKTMTGRLTHVLNLSDQHLLRWELGYEHQSFKTTERKNFGPSVITGQELIVDGTLTTVTGTDFIYLPNVSRHFHYLSVQDEWHASEQLQFNLGLRYDRYSDFGTSVNPRLGVIWQLSKEIAMKFFAGTAFKSPAVTQLHAKNNPVALGNKSLQPETVDTLETGVNLDYALSDNATVTINAFSYHAKDLIDFTLEEQLQGNVAKNIGEQKGKGLEAIVKWKPKQAVTLDLSYSYLSAKDHNKDRISGIANHMLTSSIHWAIDEHWQWNVSAKWLDERARAVSDNRKNLPGYTLVNSKLEYRHFVDSFNIALVVNNLFDIEGDEPSNGSVPGDYPIPGRKLLLEFSYHY